MTDLEAWARSLFKEHSTQPQGQRGTGADEATVGVPNTGGENVEPHEVQIIETSDVALAGEGRGADPVALRSAVETGALVVSRPANSNFGTAPVIGWIE